MNGATGPGDVVDELTGLLGRRVVLRYRRATAGPGEPALSDVVGELTGLLPDSVAVHTRTGPVQIPRAAITVARPVAANRRDILELERIAGRGWRAEQEIELDGWLLRLDRGWTGRANSVLPLRTPARPLAELLEQVREIYAGHALTCQIAVPLPARGLLDAELAGRCWRAERPAVVLVRRLPAGTAIPADSVTPTETAMSADSATPAGAVIPVDIVTPADAVTLQREPEQDWLDAYRYRGGPVPDGARDLLSRHDNVVFAAVRRDGDIVAIARATVDEGWLGVTALEVRAPLRRQGLARTLMAALLDWGIDQGARQCYLQVEEGNTAAMRLYAGLGFTEHHRYHYRLYPGQPDPGQPDPSQHDRSQHDRSQHDRSQPDPSCLPEPNPDGAPESSGS